MLKSLKTFANNGRVSPIVAKIVGIAGVCIVGKASEEGTLEPMHKCRGERRSLEVLVEALETEGFCLANTSYLRDFFKTNKVPVYLETSLSEIGIVEVE